VHLVQRVTHQHTHDTLRQQSDTPPGCQPGHKQASPWGVYTTCHTSMIHNTLCTWPPGIPATSQELHVPGLRQGLSTLLHQIYPAMPPCSTQTLQTSQQSPNGCQSTTWCCWVGTTTHQRHRHGRLTPPALLASCGSHSSGCRLTVCRLRLTHTIPAPSHPSPLDSHPTCQGVAAQSQVLQCRHP